MKEHIMRLNPSPFKEIKFRRKTIELRLYDDKRKEISIGDIIIFINTEDYTDFVRTKVKNLFIFASFVELYQSLPLLKCGYNKNTIATASPDDMDLYYSKEEQNRFGVIGIEIALI